MIEQLKNLPACLRLDFGCALLVASVPAHEESLVIQKKLDDRLELLLFELRTMHRKTERRLVDGRLGEVRICTFFKESLCAVISAFVHGAVQRSLASLALRVDGSRSSCFEKLLETRGVGFLCSFHQVVAARHHRTMRWSSELAKQVLPLRQVEVHAHARRVPTSLNSVYHYG